MSNTVRLLVLLPCLVGLGCHTSQPRPAGQAPTFLVGVWEDDYGSQHTVTEQAWTHHPASRYDIIAWYPAQQFLIARNAENNPGEAGLYTRIDWMPLADILPYTWAFCLSTYDAPSAEAAGAVTIANRDTPRTGCNGFPFSRMKPAPKDN